MGLQKESQFRATGGNGSEANSAEVGHQHIEELNDDRAIGDWKSRFCGAAWRQIIAELLYLVVLLSLGTLALLDAAIAPALPHEGGNAYVSTLLGIKINPDALKWIALWVAGLLGGTVFALKWLYHSVGKGLWNRDRILWRLIVPFNSATVSIFTGFLFSSGAVPFLKNEALDTPLMTLAFGFIFGYFSDNILAALQNLAQKIFGTLGQSD
ncbi:hypothetical protein [Mesorhizobium sp. M1322]|uniref:hypothetical protein n=1 Tax=Mesorhizobium sp. M1322 TaxID=2957081 RepID=UPI00333E1286